MSRASWNSNTPTFKCYAFDSHYNCLPPDFAKCGGFGQAKISWHDRCRRNCRRGEPEAQKSRKTLRFLGCVPKKMSSALRPLQSACATRFQRTKIFRIEFSSYDIQIKRANNPSVQAVSQTNAGVPAISGAYRDCSVTTVVQTFAKIPKQQRSFVRDLTFNQRR